MVEEQIIQIFSKAILMLSVSAKLHLHFCEVKHQCWLWSRRVSLPLARDSHQVHYDSRVRLANILRHNVQNGLWPGAHHHNLSDREAQAGSHSRKDTKVWLEGVTCVTRGCGVMMTRRDRGCGMSRVAAVSLSRCHAASHSALTANTDNCHWLISDGGRGRAAGAGAGVRPGQVLTPGPEAAQTRGHEPGSRAQPQPASPASSESSTSSQELNKASKEHQDDTSTDTKEERHN